MLMRSLRAHSHTLLIALILALFSSLLHSPESRAQGESDSTSSALPSGSSDAADDRPDREVYETPDRGAPDKIVDNLQEAVGKRSTNVRYFKVPEGGTHLAQVFIDPIFYETASGNMRPIDTTLEESGTSYESTANFFKTELPENISEGLVTMALPEGKISFGLVDASPRQAEVTDDQAVYRNVHDSTDVTYAPTATGLKEILELKDRNAPNSWTYDLEVTGAVSLALGTDGTTVEIKAGDETAGEIPPSFAQESPSSSGEGETFSPLARSFEDLGNGRYRMVDTLPQWWLDDIDRNFPIIVDPNFVYGSCQRYDDNDHCRYRTDPNKDAFVQSNEIFPHMGSQTLKVGINNSNYNHRSYLKFETEIPRENYGDLIYQADFWIYNYESELGNANKKLVELRRVQEWWDANKIVWGNDGDPGVGAGEEGEPDVVATPAATHTGCGANFTSCDPWHDYSVKDLLKNVVANNAADYGWRLSSPQANSIKRYWSKNEQINANRRPYLILQLNAQPSEPSRIGPAHDSEIAGAANLEIANVTDKNSDPVKVMYEVSRDWDFEPEDILDEPASTGWIDEVHSHTVAGTELEDGELYWWRVRSDDELPRDGRDYPTSSGLRRFRAVKRPPPPGITSNTHPSQTTWYAKDDANLSWNFPDPPYAAVDEYEWVLDTSEEDPAPGTGTSTTQTSMSFQNMESRKWVFHVRAHNRMGWGQWSEYNLLVDDDVPGTPALESSTHPVEGQCYTTNDPSFEWPVPNDAGSGTNAYSWHLDNSSSTVPDETADAVEQPQNPDRRSKTFVDKEDGTWFFHLRAADKVPNWGSTDHYEIEIDTTSPSAPAIQSATHPSQSTWDRDTDAEFTWSSSDQTSEVTGYSYVFDQNSSTDVDQNSEGMVTSHEASNLANGDYFLHVRARNACGLWSGVSRYHIKVAGTAPDSPVISSDTHPIEDDWFSNNDPEFEWAAPTPGANDPPIAYYAYSLDQETHTTPDGSERTTDLHKDFTNIADGTWYMHVSACYETDVCSAPDNYQINIDTTAPAAPTGVFSRSHLRGIAFQANRMDMGWIEALEDESSGMDRYVWAFRAEGPNGEHGAPPPGGPCFAPNDPRESCVSDVGDPNALSAEVDDGRYWFHVRSVDRAGNLSDDVEYGPMIVDQDGSLIPPAPSLDDELVAQSDENGLEQHYAYRSLGLGTATGYVNLHSGNLVVQQGDFSIPARGLNTVIRHTYNSHRDDPNYHNTGVGRGWSLSLSDLDGGLDFAGSVLDLDLNSPIVPSEGVAVPLGAAGKILELTDGDGTVHRFVRPGNYPAGRWESPPGVSLRVREDVSDGQVTSYRLIRPDGVTYVAEELAPCEELLQPFDSAVACPALEDQLNIGTWHITKIEDRNGNTLTMNYKFYNVPQSVSDARVTQIRHNQNDRLTAELTYDSVGNLDKIAALPGHMADDPGTPAGDSVSWERETNFNIDEDTDRLLSVTENSQEPGSDPDKRTTFYEYYTACSSIDLECMPPADCEIGSNPAITEHTARLCAVIDGRGNRTHFSYSNQSGDWRIAQVRDRLQNNWSFDFNAADPNTGERTMTVTPPGGKGEIDYLLSGRRPISQSDQRYAGANILRITEVGTALDEAGQPEDPVIENFVWDENRLVRKTDSAGSTTRMDYNDLGLVTRVIAPPPNEAGDNVPAGAPTDPIVTLLYYSYPRGPQSSSGQVAYRYDDGVCSQPATSRDRSPTVASDPVSGEGRCSAVAELVRSATATNANVEDQLRVTDFDYDGDGNLTDIIERHEPVFESGFDPEASIASAGTGDRHTSMTYYDKGALRKIDGPRSIADVTTFGNDDGTDPYGGYDISGQAKLIEDALNQEKRIAYTPYGMVGKVTDRGGRVFLIEFDKRDNSVKTTDPAGDISTAAYDRNDNRTESEAPKGVESSTTGDYSTTYEFDANDQLVAVNEPGADVGDPHGTTTIAYNSDGTRESVTNPADASTSYLYNSNLSLRQSTAPSGTGDEAVTNYFYDSAGRVRKIVSPQARANASALGDRPTKTVTYTPQGSPAVMKETPAKSGTSAPPVDQWRMTEGFYDAHGAQLEVRGPRKVAGVTSAQKQEYDSFGQITTISKRLDASDWLDYSYTYDLAGNRIAFVQPAGAVGPSGDLTTTYAYDKLNRLVGNSDPFNPGHTVEFSYLGEGQQEARIDYYKDPSDPEAPKLPQREAVHTYNPDYTERKLVYTDKAATGNPTLARCNWVGNDEASGYDANGNLMATRTVKGQSGCSGGTAVRTQTFEYDQRDWMKSSVETVDFPEDGNDPISRTQTFDYDVDGTLLSSVWDGKTTTYEHSPGGLMETASDWRSGNPASTFDYLPSGNLTSAEMGSGDVTGAFSYHYDGSLSKLSWRRSGNLVREHDDIDYDEGGIRVNEDVSITRADGASSGDTGGAQLFEHDLAGRLVAWTSPYQLYDFDDSTDSPKSHYTVDEGGNIDFEVTKVNGVNKREIDASYVHGRLQTRQVKSLDLQEGATSVVDETYHYTHLGQEKKREIKSTTSAPGFEPVVEDSSVETSYDPAGHTEKVTNVGVKDEEGNTQPDLEYVYDASGQMIARKSGDGSTTDVTFYFYWATTQTLAEETGPGGATKVRYMVSSSGTLLAEQDYEPGSDSEFDWEWQLVDSNGNVATELKNQASGVGNAIEEQKAFDPYGAEDQNGTSESDDESNPADPTEDHETDIGFQRTATDEVTGRILLGPRQYDPYAARFTTADTFVNSGIDMQLGTDPLTGNRYLFASANPVAFFENGYCSSRAYTIHGVGSCNGGGGGEGGSGGGSTSTQVATTFFQTFNARHRSAVWATMAAARTAFPTARIASEEHLGAYGRADVVVYQDAGRVAFVYEIKPGSAYGRRTGPGQVSRYVQGLAAKGYQAFRGPTLPTRNGVPVIGTGETVRVVSGTGAFSGVEFYSVNRRTKDPNHAPDPVWLPRPATEDEMQHEDLREYYPSNSRLAPAGAGWGDLALIAGAAAAVVGFAAACTGSGGAACAVPAVAGL